VFSGAEEIAGEGPCPAWESESEQEKPGRERKGKLGSLAHLVPSKRLTQAPVPHDILLVASLAAQTHCDLLGWDSGALGGNLSASKTQAATPGPITVDRWCPGVISHRKTHGRAGSQVKVSTLDLHLRTLVWTHNQCKNSLPPPHPPP
jgi:hypothetical protein